MFSGGGSGGGGGWGWLVRGGIYSDISSVGEGSRPGRQRVTDRSVINFNFKRNESGSREEIFLRTGSPHIWMLLLRLPKALAPTLVGTKLLLPIPPDRLRKSARRWVTQVAVLQARFCAVTLLQGNKHRVNPSTETSTWNCKYAACMQGVVALLNCRHFLSFVIFLTFSTAESDKML